MTVREFEIVSFRPSMSSSYNGVDSRVDSHECITFPLSVEISNEESNGDNLLSRQTFFQRTKDCANSYLIKSVHSVVIRFPVMTSNECECCSCDGDDADLSTNGNPCPGTITV